MKKLIRWIGLGLGSFLVINVAMFFFLKTTSPKVGPRADSTAVAATDSAFGEEMAILNDSTVHDSTLAAVHDFLKSVPDSLPVASSAMPESVIDSSTSAPPQTPETTRVVEQTTIPDSVTPEASNAATLAQAMQQGDSRETAKLAKLLEAMKPADAASIASSLETDQVITLIMRMKDRSAGKILAEMPIEQAAKVASRMSQMAARTRGGS